MTISLINWCGNPQIVGLEYLNTLSSTYNGVKSSLSHSSGKRYCEIYLKSIPNEIVLGVADNSTSPSTTYSMGIAATEYGYGNVASGAGYKYNSGVFAPYGEMYATGDTIGILLDMDTKQLSFSKNGVNQGVAYNISNITNAVIAVRQYYTGDIVFNFGMSDFKYQIPTGYLPYDNFATKLKKLTSDMSTGDLISCEYTATSNNHGTYANLGKATKPEIPLNGSATPDGTFYFIMVGYDLQGKKKLIPDRNIQHSISYDSLNTAGVASSSGLPIKFDGKDYTIRLLTGGVNTGTNVPSVDKNNEWDKIICESSLNGSITPGDNAVWNWNGIYSWVSSRDSANVPLRGFNLAGSWSSSVPTTYVALNCGFRPMLLVDDSSIVNIIKVTPTHLNNKQHMYCTVEANASFNSIPVDFKTILNGVDNDILSSATARVISASKFTVGDNIVKLEGADGGSTSVNIILEDIYRTKVERTFKPYDGGYDINNIDLLTGKVKV